MSILFVLTYLLCPLAMSPITTQFGIEGYAFISLLYMFATGNITGGELSIQSGPLYWTTFTASMLPFALLFLVEIYNCMNGKTSRGRAYNFGLLSLVYPGLFLTLVYMPMLMGGIIGYAGPIPLQFIIGRSMILEYGHRDEAIWDNP